MSGGAKIAVGVVVVAGIGGAFYYVMQRRQAMLASTLAAPAAPTGWNMGYSTDGTLLDGAGSSVPSISIVSGISLTAMQKAMDQAKGFAPDAGLVATMVATGPAVEAARGKGHF